MADRFFSVDVDMAGTLAAMDRVGTEIERFTKPAARVTADRVAAEAARRVRRRTGHTAQQIRVEESHDRSGYVVLAYDPSTKKHVEVYLEFGTQFMTAFPFFFNAARLEEGPYDRRMRQAIQDGIDASGLGDG
jgi:hypothetical protein